MSCTKSWTSSWQNLTTTRVVTTTTTLGGSHLYLVQGPYRLVESCTFASDFQIQLDKRTSYCFQGRSWKKVFTFSIKYSRQLIPDGIHLCEGVTEENGKSVLFCQAPNNGVYWYKIEPITSRSQTERSTTMSVKQMCRTIGSLRLTQHRTLSYKNMYDIHGQSCDLVTCETALVNLQSTTHCYTDAVD